MKMTLIRALTVAGLLAMSAFHGTANAIELVTLF